MKRVITPAVHEESERLCDVTGKPAVARLLMTFGYGSVRDGDVLDVDLSSEAAEEVLKLLQSKHPTFLPAETDNIMNCPWCGRS